MFHLTRQESSVLFVFVLIVFAGSSLNYILKKYPHLDNIINVVDNERYYYKVDVNKASEEDLIRIPYIGPFTAKQILEFRKANGNFQSIDQVQDLKGIKKSNFDKFSRFLKISN